LIKNSTCFREIYHPSSRVSTLYTATGICHATYVDRLGHLERMEDSGPKRSSLKNWKGQEEEEDLGKDGKRK